MKHREPQDQGGRKATVERPGVPEAFRSRAIAAAGLFAVATAACLLGVFWEGHRFADSSIFALFAATGAAYVLAVVLFLLAALVPVRVRTRAPGLLMAGGAALGGLAIVGTFATALLSVLDHRDQSVWVYVRQDVVLHDLRHSCAGLPHPFQARVDLQELSQPVAHVHVTCKNGATTFVLPSTDVFVVDN